MELPKKVRHDYLVNNNCKLLKICHPVNVVHSAINSKKTQAVFLKIKATAQKKLRSLWVLVKTISVIGAKSLAKTLPLMMLKRKIELFV